MMVHNNGSIAGCPEKRDFCASRCRLKKYFFFADFAKLSSRPKKISDKFLS
jgi:hypothetical protein